MLLHVRYGVASIDHSRRLVGISGAILVQLLLIAFILSGLPKFSSVPRSVHEMILVLTPKVKRAEPRPKERLLPHPTANPPLTRYPSYAPAIGPRTAPRAKGLSIPLLRCAPGNFEKLSPEDQQNCSGFGMLPSDNDTEFALRSHVRDPARRTAELAAREAPARVDCATAVTRVIDNIAQDNGVMVDTACALRKIRHALGQ